MQHWKALISNRNVINLTLYTSETIIFFNIIAVKNHL